MDTDLTAMAGESYQRAYGAMVNVQMLSELEEVIQFKLVPERREAIKLMWWDRLQVIVFPRFTIRIYKPANIYEGLQRQRFTWSF